MKRLSLVPLVLLSITWFFVRPAAAQNPDAPPTGPLLISCDDELDPLTKEFKNPCGIDDFFNQFVVLAQFGLSIATILGVLMLVWGGVQWITAGGRASKIDEGKRILGGTIIGLIVSFTAFVIINFVVASITGTTARSLNPFGGPIATIFGGQRDLEKPFSGGGTDSTSDCHSRWDNSCSDKIFCADASRRTGAIRDLQTALNERGCNCGGVDGCFGSNTLDCVRRFQLANNRPPTGEIDQVTQQLVAGGGTACNDAAVSARVEAVSALLPSAPAQRPARPGSATTGCCIVKTSDGASPLFCAELMSERTCLALSRSNTFVPGERCLQNAETKAVCGFCDNGGDRCFAEATEHWCKNVVSPAISFTPGVCHGNGLCDRGCQDTLYNSPSI
ncbi:MAG: peptidoglycan-binding protein [Candidatus Kerfeldbacteria bacterium]|nr:peptidoglycan-binding protein [Candidatus Kerfeldbacteria bacterium]